MRSPGWLLILAVTSCGPACSDEEERLAAREVEVLVRDDGLLSRAAAARLVARGADAIVHLEAGLYTAEAPGRLRIVAALASLETGEVAPILAHLARRDPDPEVRAAAEKARKKLKDLVAPAP